jgi:hypothetical protein
MKNSIVEKKQLPESEEEFKVLLEAKACKFENCVACKKMFTSLNTHTEAGWRETQISGICETCFDKAFGD